MDKKAQTINAYDASAEALSRRYADIGARISDIEEAFALIPKPNPKVLEIGFGTGRDAEEILKRTNDYLGIDLSEGMTQVASKRIPGGKFIVADLETFEFPANLDIVFSFASLIHTPKETLEPVFRKIFAALNPGGVARISMKYAHEYREETTEGEYGTRTFYLYSQEDMHALAPGFFDVKNARNVALGHEWLELLLQKPLKP